MTVDAKVSSVQEKELVARPKWERFINSDTFIAIVFLALPLIFLFLTKFAPIIYNVVISFTSYDLSPVTKFVGLQNYVEIFQSEVLVKSIWNTLLFVLGVVPAGTFIALVIAVLLNQQIRGRVVFRTFIYLPVVTAVTAVALVWRWIFNPDSGLVNQALAVFNINGPGWLSDPSTALLSIIIIQLWGSIGSNMVVFLAGLQGIPVEVYEAAEIDGAVPWQSFFYITIPMLNPVIIFVVITYTIAVFRSFGLIFLLTQGGPSYSTTTLVWEIYETAFGYLRFGLGAAISFVLLMVVLALSVPFRLFSHEEVY
jgi:multiple sugar transport system permease protein